MLASLENLLYEALGIYDLANIPIAPFELLITIIMLIVSFMVVMLPFIVVYLIIKNIVEGVR